MNSEVRDICKHAELCQCDSADVSYSTACVCAWCNGCNLAYHYCSEHQHVLGSCDNCL